MLPPGLLLDLDDTILTYDAIGAEAWRRTTNAYAAECGVADAEVLHQTLDEVRGWYWSDPERHRAGRLRLDDTRAEVTLMGLQRLGRDDAALARRVSDAYARERDALIGFFPGAREALEAFRAAGVKLALMTNGASAPQRHKLARFDLEGYFDTILVEGELGFGKPDTRVYTTALERLGLSAEQVWAVGDNLEWDVAGPQRLGIHGIWNDYRRRGLPEGSPVVPDRIIHSLGELVSEE